MNQVKSISSTEVETQSHLTPQAKGGAIGLWLFWEQDRPYLHSHCIQWMDSDCIDAKEALDRATLTNWEKTANFRSWRTCLNHKFSQVESINPTLNHNKLRQIMRDTADRIDSVFYEIDGYQEYRSYEGVSGYQPALPSKDSIASDVETFIPKNNWQVIASSRQSYAHAEINILSLSQTTLETNEASKKAIDQPSAIVKSESFENPANIISYTTDIFSDAIAEIFATASATGVLKYSEYNRLTAVALNCSLDKDHAATIKRILRFVRKGYIQLVDDLL